MQEHLETFFAQVEAAGGATLAQFVRDEFEALLECRILRFLRVCCAGCGYEKVVSRVITLRVDGVVE